MQPDSMERIGLINRIARWKTGDAMNVPDVTTFYTPGPSGYTDYPELKK